MRGWFKPRPPTASERFAASLPPGPLVQHVTQLHAVLMHLGAADDVREIGEHHLRSIAIFTRIEPNRWMHQTQDRSK